MHARSPSSLASLSDLDLPLLMLHMLRGMRLLPIIRRSTVCVHPRSPSLLDSLSALYHQLLLLRRARHLCGTRSYIRRRRRGCWGRVSPAGGPEGRLAPAVPRVRGTGAAVCLVLGEHKCIEGLLGFLHRVEKVPLDLRVVRERNGWSSLVHQGKSPYTLKIISTSRV